MTMSILDALRSSKKGNLIYDKYWFEDGRIEEVVTHCSSPPQVSVDLLTAALERVKVNSPPRNEETDSPETAPRHRKSWELLDHEGRADHTYARRLSPELSASPVEGQSYVESALIQCEQEWEQIVKERIKEKEKQLEEHSRQVQEQAQQSMALQAQQRELKQRALVRAMGQAQREMDEKRERRLMHEQERQRLHRKRLDAKLKAALLQREADELEKKKRERERQDFMQSMNRVKGQVLEAARKIINLFDPYAHKEFLSPEGRKIREDVKALCETAGALVREPTDPESFSEVEKKMQTVVEQLMQKQEDTIRAIAEADRKYQEDVTRKEKEKAEKEKQEQERAQQEQQAKVDAAQTKTSEPLPSASSSASSSSTSASAVSLETCISPEALTEYTRVEEKHKAVEESVKGLSKTTDKDVKKYRFDLQKAVNTPINTVSVQSGSHLLDKLYRLKDLLTGREVDLAGKRVKAATPTSLTYVKELAAKKLVKQGDEQISSNHESAFAFAAIAVALWQDVPEVGDLLLYHLYHSCPFLVPYHMAKKEGQSLEDFYKALGYSYESDGQVEKQDKYLKRMTGYTRLYAAIIATPPLRGQAHPHGVDRGWMFICRLLNLEPQPDITATTLFDFLEVCGQALAEAYGKQFFKLLQTVHRNYFPKIEAVTPQGSGGPVMRLKNFLEECLRRQRVSSPKGFLTSDFWRS